jgi:isoleucyl-tRNA synthetase
VPAADAPKVEQFRELIAAETLATSLDVVADDGVGELGVSVEKA